jgi:hypothetical protein
MEGYGGPAQPSPTIGQCLNGGLAWLQVKCHRCKTEASIPLDCLRRPRDTPIWMSAAVILARLIEPRLDLVPAVLEPLVLPVSEKLSKSDPGFWRDAHLFFHVIRQFAPSFLERMLDAVDPATAESNWIAGIKSPSDVRRVTAILVDAASSRGDAVGEMARRIRSKYPAKSKPIQEDVEEFKFK